MGGVRATWGTAVGTRCGVGGHVWEGEIMPTHCRCGSIVSGGGMGPCRGMHGMVWQLHLFTTIVLLRGYSHILLDFFAP